MANPAPLRIAVLINTPPGNEFWNDVRGSYRDAFGIIAPSSQVDMYDRVLECHFPNPREYDLIVLSGGKADASSSESWVLRVLKFLQKTARKSPTTKILGICWGHQAILRAFGGEIRPVPTGPIAGIEDVKLTDAGKKFFSTRAGVTTYRLPEFHVREVARPGVGFVHLAESHEIFVDQENTVLSFQAHPEVQAELAKKMLLEEDDVYNGNLSEKKISWRSSISQQMVSRC